MTGAYVISVLVATGDPDGVRVVEKSNWSGRGVVFARSDLTSAKSFDLDVPGVYILLGEDPDGAFDEQVYVGQAERIITRLGQHIADPAKDFWTRTVVFTSKDLALNRADILYLEHRLLELAEAARSVRISNTKRTTAPTVSAMDRAKAEGYLAELLGVLPVIGVNAFEVVTARQSAGAVRYHLSGPNAAGDGEDRAEGFVVFKGSTGRIAETASLSQPFVALRKKLVAQGLLVERDGVYVLTEDHAFRSPSTAAMVLLGRNANGRMEWRDRNGVTLKEHQERAAEGLLR